MIRSLVGENLEVTLALTQTPKKVKVDVGSLEHNFHINGRGTPDLQPGRSARLTVRFRHKGRYRYLCTEPGHAAAGMRGVFTVR